MCVQRLQINWGVRFRSGWMAGKRSTQELYKKSAGKTHDDRYVDAAKLGFGDRYITFCMQDKWNNKKMMQKV